MRVDMLAIPSNEWMENPGFGALFAVYRACGPELDSYIRANCNARMEDGTRLRSGDVFVTPTFGALREKARWLAHAVGINWHSIVPMVGGRGMDAQSAKARAQSALLRRIFVEAQERGAKSVALAGISVGARRFPPPIMALLTIRAAKRAILEADAQGKSLHVYCVSYGPVSTRSFFESARALELSGLVDEADEPKASAALAV